jgi:hypothetical protein
VLCVSLWFPSYCHEVGYCLTSSLIRGSIDNFSKRDIDIQLWNLTKYVIHVIFDSANLSSKKVGWSSFLCIISVGDLF